MAVYMLYVVAQVYPTACMMCADSYWRVRLIAARLVWSLACEYPKHVVQTKPLLKHLADDAFLHLMQLSLDVHVSCLVAR